MATNAPATIEENPLKRFDPPVLKAMESSNIAAGVNRAMFQPTNMGEAMELAKLMAASNFVPPHLRGKAGDCLAVVMQASRWAMDVFAVASKSYFVSDRIAYEAQLVNAVINSSGMLNGRLKFEWEGEGNELVVTVSGYIHGEPDVKKRRVAIKNITTRNSPLWKQDPEQQIGYYASRAWVRLHAPEVLMGVYTPDEVESIPAKGEAREMALRSVTEMIEDQAREDVVDHNPETGEITETVFEPEGRAETDMGEMTALETAKAQLDDAPNIATVNSRVAVLRKDLSAEDGAALQSYAMGLIAEMKGAA